LKLAVNLQQEGHESIIQLSHCPPINNSQFTIHQLIISFSSLFKIPPSPNHLPSRLTPADLSGIIIKGSFGFRGVLVCRGVVFRVNSCKFVAKFQRRKFKCQKVMSLITRLLATIYNL
jgi:hypothetical protein